MNYSLLASGSFTTSSLQGMEGIEERKIEIHEGKEYRCVPNGITFTIWCTTFDQRPMGNRVPFGTQPI